MRPDCAITMPFGCPVAVSADGRSGFPPGAVFAQLVRAAAPRGPDRSRLMVLRAGGAQQRMNRFAGVYPGAEILLCVTGKGRSERVFRAVTALRRLGIDLAEASPAWFAAMGAAVAMDVRPRPYSDDQHAAHRALGQVGRWAGEPAGTRDGPVGPDRACGRRRGRAPGPLAGLQPVGQCPDRALRAIHRGGGRRGFPGVEDAEAVQPRRRRARCARPLPGCRKPGRIRLQSAHPSPSRLFVARQTSSGRRHDERDWATREQSGR